MKIFIVVLIAMVCMPESRASDIDILTSFDEQNRNLDWYIVNDTVMGGRSNSRIEFVDNRMIFSGVLNTKGGGFASIRTVPENLDIGPVDRVVLRVRGDGRIYKMRLMSSESRIAYSVDIPTQAQQWLEVELPLTSFVATWRGRSLDRPPIESSAIASIGFMIADNRDGPFLLEVEWVGWVQFFNSPLQKDVD